MAAVSDDSVFMAACWWLAYLWHRVDDWRIYGRVSMTASQVPRVDCRMPGRLEC